MREGGGFKNYKGYRYRIEGGGGHKNYQGHTRGTDIARGGEEDSKTIKGNKYLVRYIG